MTASRHERRKKIIVNPEAQRRIVLSITLFPAIGLALTCLIVAAFSRRLLGEAMRAEAELPSLVPFLFALLFFVLISASIVLVQALRFSHRVVGPAYRLSQSLKRLRTGDAGFRVKLRDGDYLTEVADELNLTLEWLQTQLPPPAPVVDIVDVEPALLPESSATTPAHASAGTIKV